MTLHPVADTVLIEPILTSELERTQLQKRVEKTGLLVGKLRPEFEKVPNTGKVYAVPDGYVDPDGYVKVGAIIIFDSAIITTKALRWEDVRLYSVPMDKIKGILIDDSPID